MPTERFYNLPEEKRIRVVRAIYEEMCRVPYDELSINKIIKKADIPRGSFYQYFENKDEVLSFMMEDFQNQLFIIIRDTLKEENGNMFKAFSSILRKIASYGENEVTCKLLKNVSQGLKYNHMNEAQSLQKRGEGYFLEIRDLIDRSMLNDHGLEDFEEVVYLLATLMWSSGIQIFMDVSKKEEILAKAEKRVNLIKYGVMKEEK